MTFELDTKALRYFTAVASHRSYTLAAASLRITQPAVTRQIQAIEREFGVRLFRREGRHIVASEAGQVLLEQASEILERIDAAGNLVKLAANEPTGRLAIGAPSATGELLLPAAVASYRKKFPKVFVHLVTSYTGDLAEMLADGRLDMALIFGAPSHGDLELQPLVDSDLGLIAPRAELLRKDPIGNRTEISLGEAAALPLIFPSRTQTLRIVVEQACAQIGVVPNVILESDSLALSKALVKTGQGFMFLGPSGVSQEVSQGELRYIAFMPPTIMKWRLSIATRRTKSSSLATRLMIREIMDVVRLKAASLGWEGKLLL